MEYILIAILIAILVFIGLPVIIVILMDRHNKRIQREKEEERQRIQYQLNMQMQLEKEKQEREERERQEAIKKAREEKAKEFEGQINSIPDAHIWINDSADPKRLLVSELGEIKTSNITKSTNIYNLSNFVVLDTETTGISVGGNRIVEVSAIKYVDFEPVEKFSTLINPKKTIPEEASSINHITNEMVAESPEFYQIKDCLNNFIGKSTIVGHNIVFDLRHLYASGLDLTKLRKYDTLEKTEKIR